MNKIDVEKVAKLAHLNLSPEQSTKLQGQLKSILDQFESLLEVNTEGVNPLVTPTEISQRLREDTVQAWAEAETQSTANAPDVMGNLFKVPPVV